MLQDSFSPYVPALLSLSGLAAMNAFQGLIGGAIKNGLERQPTGQVVAGDIKRFSFRATRTFMNGVESLPSFFTAALVSILIGVDPSWINGVCVFVLLSRLAYWLVYYAGVGGDGFGLRSIFYAFTPLGTCLLMILTVLQVI